MPLPVTFVILQHSACKSILHAAIIEKTRTGLQTGKKKEATAPGKVLILFTEVRDLGLVQTSRFLCTELNSRIKYMMGTTFESVGYGR